LPREEWALAQGKKVDPAAVASQAIEAQPSFGQIKPWRGRVVRTPNSILAKRSGGHRTSCPRGPVFQPKKRKPWRSEGTTSLPGNPCKTATLPMEIVSVGPEAVANSIAKTKNLAVAVKRTSLIHRTEIQRLRR
jgi:hypothetical protein